MGRERRRPGGARPDGPLLERPQIVDAALELTRRHGLDGMSMRKLGDELGVTSMAIYWYFSGKDELVAAITDRVFGLIELPPRGGTWDVTLRRLCHEVHAVLVAYPGIADQIYTYQNYPATALPLVERGVGTLREAGFDEVDASEAFNVIAAFVLSRAHFEAYQQLVGRTDDGESATVDERVAQGWRRLGEALDGTVPNARSYVDHLDRTGQGAGVFERGVEVIIDGFRAQLAG